MEVLARPAATTRLGARFLRRQLTTIALLAALVIALLVAVPGLRPVLDEIRAMSPGWVCAGVALELASCVSYVVVFRLFFERLPARDARALAWTALAWGALLPAGGVGGPAIAGWVMSLGGAPARWIVRRSSGLFVVTSAVNVVAVVGAGLLLVAGAAGPHDVIHAGLPALVAAALIALVVAVGLYAPAATQRGRAGWLGDGVEGIRDAGRALRRPSWRLIGATGYLGFDMAALWATLSAVGPAPPAAALALGYLIGYLANALPIPGGIGALDAGLAGALVLYGVAPADAAAAVLVYHAIVWWIPALGGLIAFAPLRRRLAPATPERAPEPAPMDGELRI